MATIQAEQDEIIRLDHPEVLVIEGGPGTGKTVVALHRVILLGVLRRDTPMGSEARVNVSKIVVSEFVSLDGVMEAPGGGDTYEHAGWAFQFSRGPDGDKFKFDELMKADALLLGRVTYEGFAQAWPSMPSDEGGYADKMNSMPKFVVSTTLEKAEWTNSTLLTGNVAEEVSELKQQLGGDILVNGSGGLIKTLMEHDLIDEYRLMVFPIVLGGGQRLFADGSKLTTLRLVQATPVGSDGVVVLTYEPVRAGKRASDPTGA